MNNLNVDKILNGTEKKKIENAFHALKESYTKEHALEYRNNYYEKPLSFILENSRYIFAEPMYGLDFYESVIQNHEIPLFRIEEQCQKIKDFIWEYGDNMHPEQKKRFESMETMLERKEESLHTEIMLESLLFSKGETEQSVDDYYDSLYEYTKNSDDIMNTERLRISMESMSPLSIILHSTGVSDSIAYNMMEAVRDTYTANVSDIHSFRANMESVMFLDRLQYSSKFMESVRSMTNVNVIMEMAKIADIDTAELLTEECEKLHSNTIPSNLTGKDAVNAIFESSVISNSMKDLEDEEIFGFLYKKHEAYESCLELVRAEYETCTDTMSILPETKLFTYVKENSGYTGPMTIEDGYHLMIEAVAEVEMYMREYETNGMPNKVIAKSTSGLRDNPSKNTDDDGSDDDVDGTGSTGGKLVSNINIVSSNSANNPNMKPVKPKHGIVKNIQNAALDIHAKSKVGASKIKKLGTDIKNAGKAVLKIPSNVLDNIKQTRDNFDKADDNRRKEYMMKPGFRKKWFRTIRTAATYGLAAHVSAMLIPVTWFCGRMSKEKNKRMRTELVAELDTEIKVTEEKINDANAAGDQKQKYELMRLRDKLTQEKNRVISNSKYI